jgi:hypothetical protein
LASNSSAVRIPIKTVAIVGIDTPPQELADRATAK